MMDKSKEKEYYQEMANLLDNLIPCEWTRTVLYAEASEDKVFFTFYFKHKYGQIYKWSQIPTEYLGYVNMKKIGKNLRQLEKVIKEFYLENKFFGENVWHSFTYDLNNEWNFDVKFGYEEMNELPDWEKDIRFAYDTLAVLPKHTNERKALKKYLEKNGRELPEKLRDKERRYDKQVIIKDTPEKYMDMADKIVPFLKEFLTEINKLEEEVSYCYNKITQDKYKLGIEAHIEAPGGKELDQYHREKFLELAKKWCTEELINEGYAVSWSNPPEYGYIDGDCQIVFIMKSAKRAVIETRYYKAIEKRHQFVMKLTDDGWRVNEKKYAFGSDKTWHKTGI